MLLQTIIIIITSFLFGAVFGSLLNAKEKQIKYDIKEILRSKKHG